MASRVNKKFVIILTASLIGVFAVVSATAWYVISSKPQKNMANGDDAYEAGDFVEAKKLYGRAVAKEATNIAWLEKFGDAILRATPPTRAEYDKFYDDHERTMARLARLKERDIDAQIEYVKFRDEVARVTGATSSSLKSVEQAVDDAMDYLRDDDPKLPELLRYSALATVDRMQREAVETAEKEQARKYLEDAIEYDAEDYEVALAMAEFEFAEMGLYRRNRLPDRAQSAYERGIEILDEFLAEHPGNPAAIVLKTRMEFQEGNRRAVSPAERAAFLDRIAPKFTEAVEAFAAADPKTIAVEDLQTLVGLAYVLRAHERPELLATVDKVANASPEDLRLAILSGDLKLRAGEYEGAIEMYESIVEAPVPPVSIRGRMLPFFQRDALAKMVDVALAEYSTTKNQQEQQAAIAKARAFRDRLEEIAGVRGAELLALRDAKLAIVDQNYQLAVSKLSDIIKSDIGDPVQNHNLLAHSLEKLGNLGEAKAVLVDLLEIEPDEPSLLVRIAEYEINFSNFQAALENLEKAAELQPDNERIAKRIREVKTAIDPESADADPLVATVMKSRSLRDENKLEEAEVIVRRAIDEHASTSETSEYRLVRELTEILTAKGDKEGALDVINEAIETNPDDVRFQQVRLIVQEEDPVELGLKLVDMSDATAVDKLVDKHQVYLRHNRLEDANRMLDQAREQDPFNPRVIDLDFITAMADGDKDRAAKSVERATQANADQVNGRLYSARFEMIYGDIRKAIEILEEVTEDSPHKPAAWLLLGEARLSGGRIPESVEAFKKAYEGRPTDSQLVKAYARGLIRVNREAEALALIAPENTGVLRQTISDPELMEMYLRLGEQYGSRSDVYSIRRDLYNSAPTVFQYRNAVDFFRMNIEDENWDEAQRVYDELSAREEFSDLQSTVLLVNLVEARDGGDAADATFSAFIDSLTADDEDVLLAHLNFGDYLIRRGKLEEGIAAYEAARPYQTEILEADRKLGDLYFNRGSRQGSLADAAASQGQQDDSATYRDRAETALKNAAKHYEAITGSPNAETTDIDQVVKRYSETLLKLGQLADAKAMLENLKTDDEDLELIVLRASIATAEGDRRAARDIYDRAVEKFPSSTLPYIQRALFNADNPELLGDAVADLQQAVVLDAGRTQAWVKLYELRRAQGDFDTAFADLRRALEANPNDEALERLLISELFSAGRREEGLVAAQEAVRKRPDNEQWIGAVAQIMARAARYREAASLYQRLIELDTADGSQPNANYVAGLLDMSMRRTDIEIPKPRMTEMLRSFRAVLDDTSVYHLMLEARALTEIELVDEAFGRLQDALVATETSGPLGALWFQQLQLVTTQRERSYQFLQQQENRGELNPYLVVQLQNYKRNEGSAIEPLVERLDQVLAGEPDLLTQLEALKTKSRFLYTMGDYQASADAILRTLEITPADPELNNNLAFIYVEHLQNFEKAVEFAERALARDARSSATLDTLGWAYYHVGRLKDARNKLRDAVDLATTDAERVPARIHLGYVEAKDGNLSAARREYDQALQILKLDRTLAGEYEEKIEKLGQQLQ